MHMFFLTSFSTCVFSSKYPPSLSRPPNHPTSFSLYHPFFSYRHPLSCSCRPPPPMLWLLGSSSEASIDPCEFHVWIGMAGLDAMGFCCSDFSPADLGTNVPVAECVYRGTVGIQCCMLLRLTALSAPRLLHLSSHRPTSFTNQQQHAPQSWPR